MSPAGKKENKKSGYFKQTKRTIRPEQTRDKKKENKNGYFKQTKRTIRSAQTTTQLKQTTPLQRVPSSCLLARKQKQKPPLRQIPHALDCFLGKANGACGNTCLLSPHPSLEQHCPLPFPCVHDAPPALVSAHRSPNCL